MLPLRCRCCTCRDPTTTVLRNHRPCICRTLCTPFPPLLLSASRVQRIESVYGSTTRTDGRSAVYRSTQRARPAGSLKDVGRELFGPRSTYCWTRTRAPSRRLRWAHKKGLCPLRLNGERRDRLVGWSVGCLVRRAQRTVFMRCYDPFGEHTCAGGVLTVALTLQRAIFFRCNVSAKGVRNFDSSVDRLDAFSFYSSAWLTVIFLKRKLFISAFVLQGVSSVLKQIVGNITGRIVDYLAQVVAKYRSKL